MTSEAVVEYLQRWRADLDARLDRIEHGLRRLLTAEDREWYTVGQLAARLRRSTYSVRELCRTGRLRAVKTRTGRRNRPEWRVSHEEYVRYLKEGPLTTDA